MLRTEVIFQPGSTASCPYTSLDPQLCCTVNMGRNSAMQNPRDDPSVDHRYGECLRDFLQRLETAPALTEPSSPSDPSPDPSNYSRIALPGVTDQPVRPLDLLALERAYGPRARTALFFPIASFNSDRAFYLKSCHTFGMQASQRLVFTSLDVVCVLFRPASAYAPPPPRASADGPFLLSRSLSPSPANGGLPVLLRSSRAARTCEPLRRADGMCLVDRDAYFGLLAERAGCSVHAPARHPILVSVSWFVRPPSPLAVQLSRVDNIGERIHWGMIVRAVEQVVMSRMF